MAQPDINLYAQSFAQHGALTLSNILPEELANNMYEEFESLDWVLQVKDYTQTARFEIPVSEVANRDNLIEAIYSNKHDIDLNNLFYIRLAVAEEDIKAESLAKVTSFLNTGEFIDKCRKIVGMKDINRLWLEATCYEKGCFLGSHSDDHLPENRVAVVLYLSKDWHLDWGGLLMLRTNPNTQPLILPPSWNTLSMFRIPVDHAVSSVSQAATGHRYSITGWLRP